MGGHMKNRSSAIFLNQKKMAHRQPFSFLFLSKKRK